ncbi:RagB/SusD family nutrient uptake outer membrane protein [Pedobacter nyackensis]|uniref:RagB/SusD family nutrient uptake outer membrane protein n=1 Tax=Pedobacter nyackensis TaxID=475255 RepID=UPI00292E2202|nr:RagB/SusD family nutrient uptake outer membrane protein [Pedobacter nyackensis]
MKVYINTKKAALLLMLGTGLTLSSCNKWLDVQPKTELKQEDLFSTQQGFYEAMTGAYVTMTDEGTYGRELTIGMLSVMASDYSVESSSQQAIEYLKPVENFDYEKGQFKSMIGGIWLKQYNTVAQVNAILENIDAKKHLFTGENFNLIKGEALALRAYIHFDLLRLFAPAYVAKDAQKYLPYVTSYGRNATPFSDVDGVINATLKDLDEAEVLLVKDPIGNRGTVDRQLRMNLYAVKGLKARIYLYMGNKPLAFAKAKEVIDANKVRLMAAGTDVNLDRSFHTEHLFSIFKEKHDTRVVVWLRVGDGTGNGGVPYYFTTQTKLSTNIFKNQPTDVRFKMPMIMPFSGNLTPHKYLYEDLSPSTLGMKKNYIPLMRISEIYYIAAEAAPDAATGFEYLNKVLTSRGLQTLTVTADLQAELKSEYRKEFFTEGQTFYYYKRLNANQLDDSPVTQMTAQTYVLPLPDDEKIFGGR